MAKAAGRLGKGLAALLDEMGTAPPLATATGTVAIDLIDPNPRQPRQDFDEARLEELAQSIRERGILQPLLLRPRGSRYEIVAGERRWRAAQRAGLHEVPAIVRDFDDATTFEAAIIENVQRADLNPLEEADAYNRLAQEFGHTQETIARLTGKARSHIANLLRLLDLPRNAQAAVRAGQVSLGIAKLALSAPDPELFIREAAARGFSVRQAEAWLASAGRRAKVARARAAARDPDIAALEASLADALGLVVMIRQGAGTGHGELVIRYESLDQLDQVIARLQG
ncbi:ParB/RepB/Spo0J family partition protein [Thermaurantiacus tibetensis]|uniref:ParB/RepB/Spo0J family partition protein n=1 Tax=Thermaurantiacus tibetensis TaxID=2759035 RepID=UPI00188FE8B7|nr:ParB/RepB/Spo0J family partition protein [Thermaurantiacus tibetensis]